MFISQFMQQKNRKANLCPFRGPKLQALTVFDFNVVTFSAPERWVKAPWEKAEPLMSRAGHHNPSQNHFNFTRPATPQFLQSDPLHVIKNRCGHSFNLVTDQSYRVNFQKLMQALPLLAMTLGNQNGSEGSFNLAVKQ